MQTRLHSSLVIRRSSFTALGIALVGAFTLLTATPRVSAQNDTVTLSAADFQRLVYSAQLQTELALKPDLQASLQTLLEIQRRNPTADPAALVGVLTNALQIYWTSEPYYIRTNGYPDEVLAAYLDCLRQLPAHTNFVSADMTLLNLFMLAQYDYDASNNPPATLIESLADEGTQRLYSSQNETLTRQALVTNCVARAQYNAGFAAAMDQLLVPETGVSLADTPAEMIGNTNSPLYDDPTMTNLLALSEASGDGSLTVSSNQVMSLFTDEMQTMWDTVNTNLAVLAQINQSQPDVLSYLTYLTNQAAIEATQQDVAAVQQGQPATLACSTAAVLVQSQLLPIPAGGSDTAEQIEGTVSAVTDLAQGAAELEDDPLGGLSDIFSGGCDLFGEFSGPSQQEVMQEQMATQLTNITTMVGDLSTNMNYRFDRVDQSLTTIYSTMNQQFSNIDITLNAQGQQLVTLQGSVDDIRSSLATAEASLNLLNSELFTDFNTSQRQDLVLEMNGALVYQIQNPGETMTWDTYSAIDGPENTFYTYATSLAEDANSSPTYSGSLPPLASQLTGLPLDANLNYIQEFLSGIPGQPTTGGTEPLANPRDWFEAAYAYLELAVENPMLYREKGSVRVPAIISAGQNLENFLGSLTFSGANFNWNLWNALESYYFDALTNFDAQVSALETTYAANNNVAVATWRQWDVADPRVTATATEVVSAPETWNTTGTGQAISVPLGLTNVVAIAAQWDCNLALKADGTVVAFGDNSYGENNVPAGLSNVVAIAAGDDDYMALKNDGTVVVWGGNTYGQTNVPPGLSNVVAIASGDECCLALGPDGTVVGWGSGYSGAVIPGVSNVVAIAADLGLRADGTVVDLTPGDTGYVYSGLSNIVALTPAMESWIALKADGTVVDDAGNPAAPGVSNVVAIAASYDFGAEHFLALKADGTVVGWGDNSYGEINIPSGLSNVVAIAAGECHSLFLTTTNTGAPAANGPLSFLLAQIPAGVPALIQGCNQNTLTELGLTGSSLDNAAAQLSGAKMLLTDVLELGMPYTLERDGVLHGFLYGSQSLMDTNVATTFLQAQNVQLQTSPTTPPPDLTEVAALGYLGFQERLNQCLTNLQATGQPEIPRLVGHTMRLLNLLQDAWTPPPNSPPPTLEMWSVSNSPCLLLYGEPYVWYTLQYGDSLSVPGWTTTTITNLEDGQIITPPLAGTPQRFYRLMLPMP